MAEIMAINFLKCACPYCRGKPELHVDALRDLLEDLQTMITNYVEVIDKPAVTRESVRDQLQRLVTDKKLVEDASIPCPSARRNELRRRCLILAHTGLQLADFKVEGGSEE